MPTCLDTNEHSIAACAGGVLHLLLLLLLPIKKVNVVPQPMKADCSLDAAATGTAGSAR
jgi:hypothetical protein